MKGANYSPLFFCSNNGNVRNAYMGSYFRLYIRNNNVHTDWKGSDEYLSAGGLKFFLYACLC